jgi:hypothetical protein
MEKEQTLQCSGQKEKAQKNKHYNVVARQKKHKRTNITM